MIRGVGKDVIDSRTEFVAMTFYRPRDQKFGPLECAELRIVQRMSIVPNTDRRMSWDFPDIKAHLNGRIPSNLESLTINCHWRDADLFKAAYSLNKSDSLIIDIYFGNMSESDRKNRMIRNTVTFQPKISLPKAKNSKYLHLSTDETLPMMALGSSLLTINRKWSAFWDDSWLTSKY